MRTIEVALPILHPGQVDAFRVVRANSRTAIRCGRRWGKTDLGKTLACDASIHGGNVLWGAPNYKISAEAFYEIAVALDPVKQSSSKIDGVIRTISGGRIDFWTLDDERAGRSRKYDLLLLDEVAFTKPNMMAIWERSLEPTLLDTGGKCVVMSNTNGIAEDNFLYQICHDTKYGFIQYHAPSRQNPHIPQRFRTETDEEWELRRDAVFAKIQAEKHPLVYRQEYLAEFVDFSGVAFFSQEYLLADGKPVEYPSICDSVFAIIDTAVKTGSANDGTAVSYWAISQHFGHKLICLDWDIVQIEGSLLEAWIPNVFLRLEQLALECRARMGSAGALIEDAQSGSILLQQCARRGLPATALPQALTAAGKDARALNISGYVYRGLVKFSRFAFDKVTTFKEIARNHMLAQVTGFRVGDKDAARRSDDLLDTFCYAVAVSLGNSEGY